MIVPFLDYAPIDNPPQRLEVCGAAVLVVEVVGVFPNVEGEEGPEAVGDGVVGAGVLADGQGAGGIGPEPHPPGPEQADALGDELLLEGFEGAPLRLDLLAEGRFRVKPGMRSPGRSLSLSKGRPAELREVQVVVQDLAGVVEDGFRFFRCAQNDRRGARNDNLLQRHRLELGAGDELVEIVHIALQVLAVVEFQSARADDGLQPVQCVR